MSISWHLAAKLCGGDTKRNPSWPERLSAEQVAMLLAKGECSDYLSIERALSSAIARGELSASDGSRERDEFILLCGAIESTRLRAGSCKMVDAKAVREWLSRQGEPENTHVSAWARATGRQVEGAAPVESHQEGGEPGTLTQMKRAAIIELLGRRYPRLESALSRPEEWAKACSTGKHGWYYLEHIEAECLARYGGSTPAPAIDMSPAGQLRRITR